MTYKKTVILGASALAAGIVIVGGIPHILAQTTTTTYPAGIQKVAETFNLDPAKVQEAFESGRKEERSNHLEQLVTDRKITSEQKAKIEEFQSRIEEKRNELKSQGISKDDAREQMKSLHDEFQSWIKAQGLENVLKPQGPRERRP